MDERGQEKVEKERLKGEREKRNVEDLWSERQEFATFFSMS
jgi:hypothetical protein